MKTLQVSAGDMRNPVFSTAELNGVGPDERLTPKMARQAARIAFGHCHQVTVWDTGSDRAYRLYKNSARKVSVE